MQFQVKHDRRNKWGIVNDLLKDAWSNLLVARVGNLVRRDELLLDRAQADEAGEQVSATGLVVRTTGTRTTERLLTNNSTGALAVDVEVTGGVAEGFVRNFKGLAVLGEHGASQAIFTGLVDLLGDTSEVGLGGIAVGVDDEDRAEELAGKKGVVGVGCAVNSGLDVPALGRVIGASSNQLKLGVILGFVDDLAKLVERRLVDNGTAEVRELRRRADLQVLSLSSDLFHELIGDRGSHVRARCSTALLALEFERTTNGLDGGIAHVGRLVNKVEVLATSLSDNAGVAAVLASSNSGRDLAIQVAEDVGATGEVESSEVGVVKNSFGHLFSFTRNKLDNVLGQTCLEQDLVDQPVGRDGGWGRLPDNNVTHERRSTSQVTTNSSEVERTDGIDESLQRAVFNAASLVSILFLFTQVVHHTKLTSKHQTHCARAAAHTDPRHT